MTISDFKILLYNVITNKFSSIKNSRFYKKISDNSNLQYKIFMFFNKMTMTKFFGIHLLSILTITFTFQVDPLFMFYSGDILSMLFSFCIYISFLIILGSNKFFYIYKKHLDNASTYTQIYSNWKEVQAFLNKFQWIKSYDKEIYNKGKNNMLLEWPVSRWAYLNIYKNKYIKPGYVKLISNVLSPDSNGMFNFLGTNVELESEYFHRLVCTPYNILLVRVLKDTELYNHTTAQTYNMHHAFGGRGISDNFNKLDYWSDVFFAFEDVTHSITLGLISYMKYNISFNDKIFGNNHISSVFDLISIGKMAWKKFFMDISPQQYITDIKKHNDDENTKKTSLSANIAPTASVHIPSITTKSSPPGGSHMYPNSHPITYN